MHGNNLPGDGQAQTGAGRGLRLPWCLNKRLEYGTPVRRNAVA
jgi:hypothetical protein